eukprot:651876-Prymnesium_polylepis.1
MLLCLADSDENQVAIQGAGGIPPLVALVESGTVVQKEKAAGALIKLARNTDNKTAIHKAGGIPPLVALMKSGTEVQKEKAAGALWRRRLGRCGTSQSPPATRLLSARRAASRRWCGTGVCGNGRAQGEGGWGAGKPLKRRRHQGRYPRRRWYPATGGAGGVGDGDAGLVNPSTLLTLVATWRRRCQTLLTLVRGESCFFGRG